MVVVGIDELQTSVVCRAGRQTVGPIAIGVSVAVVNQEVYQDSLVDLMRGGTLLGASATGLTLSAEKLAELNGNMDFFGPRIVLRPQT